MAPLLWQVPWEDRVNRVTCATWRFEGGAVGALTHTVVQHEQNFFTTFEVRPCPFPPPVPPPSSFLLLVLSFSSFLSWQCTKAWPQAAWYNKAPLHMRSPGRLSGVWVPPLSACSCTEPAEAGGQHGADSITQGVMPFACSLLSARVAVPESEAASMLCCVGWGRTASRRLLTYSSLLKPASTHAEAHH